MESQFLHDLEKSDFISNTDTQNNNNNKHSSFNLIEVKNIK